MYFHIFVDAVKYFLLLIAFPKKIIPGCDAQQIYSFCLKCDAFHMSE